MKNAQIIYHIPYFLPLPTINKVQRKPRIAVTPKDFAHLSNSAWSISLIDSTSIVVAKEGQQNGAKGIRVLNPTKVVFRVIYYVEFKTTMH